MGYGVMLGYIRYLGVHNGLDGDLVSYDCRVPNTTPNTRHFGGTMNSFNHTGMMFEPVKRPNMRKLVIGINIMLGIVKYALQNGI